MNSQTDWCDDNDGVGPRVFRVEIAVILNVFKWHDLLLELLELDVITYKS